MSQTDIGPDREDAERSVETWKRRDVKASAWPKNAESVMWKRCRCEVWKGPKLSSGQASRAEVPPAKRVLTFETGLSWCGRALPAMQTN